MNRRDTCGGIACRTIDRIECDQVAGHSGIHQRDGFTFAIVPGSTLAERRERAAKRRRGTQGRLADAAELQALLAVHGGAIDDDGDRIVLDAAVEILTRRIAHGVVKRAGKRHDRAVAK